MSIRLIQAERDAIACLGILAQGYARFDSAVDYPGETAPSHIIGLNIFAALIDNCDGEVLAVERNTIHSDGSPLQHGEQRALRAGIVRVASKRPRSAKQSIESYYRTSMFMAPGTTDEAFLNVGATLYSTLEPCPMCASSALVSRIKRLVYLLPDLKYGGAWSTLKSNYYPKDESAYGNLAIDGRESTFADGVAALHDRIVKKADALRKSGIRDTHVLDHCRDELSEAFSMLLKLDRTDLKSVGLGDVRNALTLDGFQRALNMPYGP